ncbi:MAG: hypothetical protein PHE67_00455 [Campylobacterales bacterium]|nr:hypothetical protein [Campylobacterales bacterium]
MRLTVTTPTKMISLGFLAKDMFLKTVLKPDENGQYDPVQSYDNEMFEKAATLPLEGGFTERIKNGLLEALGELKEGEKFLCSGHWIIDFKSKQAKYLWEVVRLLNDGVNLDKAQKTAMESIGEK